MAMNWFYTNLNSSKNTAFSEQYVFFQILTLTLNLTLTGSCTLSDYARQRRQSDSLPKEIFYPIMYHNCYKSQPIFAIQNSAPRSKQCRLHKQHPPQADPVSGLDIFN